ncbi:DDE-type integrase/transposase/recombinase [Streptomyces lasalocidi]
MSESRFCKWRGKPVIAREVRRGQPAVAIRHFFGAAGGTYGWPPKVWITLVRQGWRVSVNTVAKLMAELGLAGRKVSPALRTDQARQAARVPGLRAPGFHRRGTGPVRAGDMTGIDMGEGKLCLATVIELFSRLLLGSAMGHDAELVVASLNMAVATRSGDVRGVIMRTGRGSEYCSRKFQRA